MVEGLMNWTCDPLGQPRLAGIHDASVARMKLDTSARSLELRLRGANGERLRFVFGEVEAVRAEELWEAAIVNTMFLWPVSRVPMAFLDDPSAGWRHLLVHRVAGLDAIAAERNRLSAKVANGYLSTIVCSYGGDISVLAGTLRINEWHRLD